MLRFLHALKAPIGVASALSVLFSAEPCLMAAPNINSTALYKIEHIIVIYQENWSFDALYGSFPGANGVANASQASLNQIDRLNGASLSNEVRNFTFNRYTGSGQETAANTVASPGFLNIPPQPLASNNKVDTRFNTDPANANSPLKVNTLLPYFLTDPLLNLSTSDTTGDIVHRYWNEQFQIAGAYLGGGMDQKAGNNQGFLTWSDNPGLVMSRFDATNLPEGQLAQQYTMCDNFFHSAFGGSFLNHQFLVAAQAPVYYNMPTANNGNIACLDGQGQLALQSDTSQANYGKVIRDGNITPVLGDVLSNLTIGASIGQSRTVGASGTPSDVVYYDGSHFGQHYAVNTIFSANLQSSNSPTATNLLPSQNDTNPSDPNRPYIQTIGDQLDAGNVSWKWYSGGWDRALAQSPSNPTHYGTTNTDPSISLFQWHHQAFAYYDKYAPFVSKATYDTNPSAYPGGLNPYSAARLQDETKFFTDVQNGTLPAVSFIKPLGPDNEHPGYTDLQRGQEHVAKIVQAVQSKPALWQHTLIVVTYDEHGGRWDHVTPPSRDIWGPGLRVPTIVISPWAKRGYVDHTQYDTTSIISTIEKRFNLGPLNARAAAAPTLENALTKDRPEE